MPYTANSHSTLAFISIALCALLLSACATSQGGASLSGVSAKEAQAISLARSYREEAYYNKARSILSPLADAKDSSAATKVEYALLLLKTSSPELAEIYARDALKIDTKNVSALHVLANSLSAQNKTSEASVIYKKAVEIGSPSYTLLNDYALNLAEQSSLEEAITITKQSLEINSDNLDTLKNLRIFETLLAAKPKSKGNSKEKEKGAIEDPPVPSRKPERDA